MAHCRANNVTFCIGDMLRFCRAIASASSDVRDVRAAVVHLIDKKVGYVRNSVAAVAFSLGFVRSATKKLNICPWDGME